jgi:diguanylate cyclase (GGDEF)-like protein
LNDGYQFIGGKLVETGIDTSAPAEHTALPNKATLLADVAGQFANGEPVAVLFMDLDDFKQVNDRSANHEEGDRCLSEIVRTAAMVLRGKGKLYRIGGDEFGALLPNFSASEAVATAERVREGVHALKPFAGVVKVTVSIGVAISDTERLPTPDSLLNAADEAMYVVKFTTKNRVCLWPPEPSEARKAEEKRQKGGRA